MPATAEPTASILDTRPRTVHDEEKRILDIYVSVSNPDGKAIVVAAPPLAVLHGQWTLRWTLVLSDDVKAEFANPPIEVDPESLPGRVAFEQKDIKNFGSYCTGPLRNEVNGANHFKYWINIATPPRGSAVATVIHHDPTIAVTPDPITKSCWKSIGQETGRARA
jgi:hypothetical protein